MSLFSSSQAKALAKPKTSVFKSKGRRETEFTKKLAEKISKDEQGAKLLKQMREERMNPYRSFARAVKAAPLVWELLNLAAAYMSVAISARLFPKTEHLDMDVLFGVHTTLWVFGPIFILGAFKMIVGFALRYETMEVLQEQEITEAALEEVETNYVKLGHGVTLTNERADGLMKKVVGTKKEFEEHQKRMNELKSQGLGTFQGETAQSFNEMLHTLSDIKPILKKEEGLQLAIAHASLFGTPMWGGLIAYVEKLFRRGKTAAERQNLTLFNSNLPTPIRPVEEGSEVDFKSAMKELEVSMRKFSKLSAEHEKESASAVHKHVHVTKQTEISVEQFVAEREMLIAKLRSLDNSVEISDLSQYLADVEPLFEKLIIMKKKQSELDLNVAGLNSKTTEELVAEGEMEHLEKELERLNDEMKTTAEGIAEKEKELKLAGSELKNAPAEKKNELLKAKKKLDEEMKSSIKEAPLRLRTPHSELDQ